MLRLVGHPVAVNPDKELARVAREEGWEIMRFERLGRKLRVAAAAALLSGGRRAAGWCAHEPPRADRGPAGDPRARARFADEKIAPRAGAVGSRPHFPRELFAELGELGLMGVCVPEEHGGAGADFLAYMLVLEELSRADAGVGVTVAVHTSAGTLPILNHGYEEQIGGTCRRSPAGEELAAFALTESGSGSDASAMRTRVPTTASPAPSSGSPTAPSPPPSSSSPRRTTGRRAFLVRAGADGFSVTREEEKMGLNSSSTADLAFEDTPGERLGEPGNGMRVALRTLDGGRIGIAAQAVGIAQAALELATGYAKERNAFGGPIARLRRDPAEARRHADRDRGRPRARLARRPPEGGRPPAHASRARRPSSSPPPSPAARPARRSRSSAATATPRSSPPSATTATPRSPRSTRARARSSGS